MKRTLVTYEFTCDLADGGDTPAVVTDFYVAIGGRGYLVDVGDDAHKGLIELMTAVRKRGRPCEEMPSNPRGRQIPPDGVIVTATTGASPGASATAQKRAFTEHGNRVRAWAAANGIEVRTPRGKIAQATIDAYNAANPDDIYQAGPRASHANP